MWRSLTLDQTWQAPRFTFKNCIAYAWMLLCHLSSFALLIIAYFLKRNYSVRQNIFEKLEGLREITHISPNWCLFGSYWSWDLIGIRQREGHWRFAEERVIRRYTGLWCPASGQFIGGEHLPSRSDRTLDCRVRCSVRSLFSSKSSKFFVLPIPNQVPTPIRSK